MGCSTSLEVRQCRRHLTSRSANRLEVGEEAMRLPLDAKSSSLVEYSSFYRWPHFCGGRSRLAACLRFHTFANRVLTSITFCASNAAGCRLMAKAYQVSTSSASFCFCRSSARQVDKFLSSLPRGSRIQSTSLGIAVPVGGFNGGM